MGSSDVWLCNGHARYGTTVWVDVRSLVCDLCFHDIFRFGHHDDVALLRMVMVVNLVEGWDGCC